MGWKIDGHHEHQRTHWGRATLSASVWHNQDKATGTNEAFTAGSASSLFVLTCRWQTGCTPAPRRRWVPGPPGSVSGPGTAGGSWMLWRIHGSPPGWPRPPRWGRSAGLRYNKHNASHFISPLLLCGLPHFPGAIIQTYAIMIVSKELKKKKNTLVWVRTSYLPLPRCCKLHVFERYFKA